MDPIGWICWIISPVPWVKKKQILWNHHLKPNILPISRAQEDTPIEICNRDKKHYDEKVERPGKHGPMTPSPVGRVDGTNMKKTYYTFG